MCILELRSIQSLFDQVLYAELVSSPFFHTRHGESECVTGGGHTNSSEDKVYFSAYWQASDERLLMEHVLPTEVELLSAGTHGGHGNWWWLPIEKDTLVR